MISYWTQVYRSINAANFAIEGIPNSSDAGFTDEDKLKYIGEARFMRGFDYFFLTNLYGDVPLILHSLSNFEEYDTPRSPRSDIYSVVLEDFIYAKENLPASWPAAYQGRPTRAAAAAYLAQVYLYMEEYANAEKAAREAIALAEGDGFQMLDDYESIFKEDNEDNNETLFKFTFVKNSPDAGTNTTVQINPNPSENEFKNILGEAWAYSLPQRDLYDEYEDEDPRRGYTIYAPGDFYGLYQNNEKTFTFKDFDNTGKYFEYQETLKPGDPVYWQYYWSQTGMGTKKLSTDLKDLTNVRWAGKDLPMMRMAELYLILAEALAEQGNAEALTWVNKVRARPSVQSPMSLPPRAVGDGRKGGDDLISIVRHERRVELALECKRLFDLLRWETLGDVFQPGRVKRHFYGSYLTSKTNPKASADVLFDQPPVVIPKHLMFPIPQVELDINTKVTTNNPGY
jgi:hypothetical protein